MTPAQCRAARALLDMTQPALAEAAGLGLSTIVDFERQRRAVSAEAVQAMTEALERAGAVLVSENGEGPGVRLRKRPRFAPVPYKTGGRFYVLATWPDGRTQQISDFESEQAARDWIDRDATAWLARSSVGS